MGFDVHRFDGEVDEELVCSLCAGVLEDPVEIPACEHAFCTECIQDYFRDVNAVCPVDQEPAVPGELRVVPRLLRNMLARLDIACDHAALGCEATLKLEQLSAHVASCIHSPGVQVLCEQGCGARVPRAHLAEHNCVAELRGTMAVHERALATVSSQMALQRGELAVQRQELTSLKALFTAWQARDTTSMMGVRNVAGDVLRAHAAAWGRGLLRARVTRWGSLQATPSPGVQRMVRRTLAEAECPTALLERLMEACVEWYWPSALRGVDERRRHLAHLDLLLLRRVPGKHAVVVLATDNPHMCPDFIVDPGYVLIFESGVEIYSRIP